MDALQQPEEIKVDPVYEFEAPQYMEFGAPEETTGAPDEWFEVKQAEDLKTEDLFASTTDFTEEAAKPSMSSNDNGSIQKSESSASDPPQLSRKRSRPAETSQSHSNGLGSSLNSSTNKSVLSLNKSVSNTSTWRPKLTVPQSPMFQTRGRVRAHGDDTETSQLRNIANTIVENAKRRRLNSFYRRKALYCSSGYMPTRSVQPLTEPTEFHFTTDDRFGVPQPHVEENTEPREPVWQGQPTIPKPFVFYTDYRVKQPEGPAPSPFKSFKQKVLEIQRKTPKRFRTRHRNYVFGDSPNQSLNLSLTTPQEFTFETDTRSKPSTYLSKEERERLEMESMPKFQARPVNRRVLESGGQLGISRVPKPPLTEAEEFKLSTEERAAVRAATTEHNEPVIEQFKARELDVSILRGPVKGLHPVPAVPLTIPSSPYLLTKSRPHPPTVVPQPEVFVFKANPVPVHTAPKPIVRQKHNVEPFPFKLQTEERGKEAVAKLTEKLQSEKQKEQDEMVFKAHPMPIYEAPTQEVRHIPPTQPTPFKLATEELGAQHKQKFVAKIQAEMQENIQQANFKAHPFVLPSPFEPQKSTKSLTVFEDFSLTSDLRAEERQVYEQQKAERTQAAEEARRKQEEEQRKQEEREIRELRKRLVPKAQPIRLGKPVTIKGSSQPLTLPLTPKLATKARSLAGRDL